jgi:simple sugar transport system substrate-binding protein
MLKSLSTCVALAAALAAPALQAQISRLRKMLGRLEPDRTESRLITSAAGYQFAIGQTEFEAGVGAGERMAEAGVTNTLCINQEVGNVALDQRCEGFEQGLGGQVEVVSVNLNDPTDAQNKIRTAVDQNPDINGMLTLGPTGADPTLAALEESDRADAVQFATFDLSPRVLDALQAGRMLFAIDQQQYLQGYLGVLLLTKYLETGALPGGGEVIRTGPGFVTTENAAAVRDLTARGIR